MPLDMNSFDAAYERMQRSTGAKTQAQLADILGIRQSSISDAKRRKSIPSEWTEKLLATFGLNPEWIRTGQGSMYLRGLHEDEEPPRKAQVPMYSVNLPGGPTMVSTVLMDVRGTQLVISFA